MQPALVLNNVSKSYQSHKVLDGINLQVPLNAIFGLLGPNGAGKTTLIRIITQILVPDDGTITLFDTPLQQQPAHLIGYLPEERGLYKKMKVGDQLLYLGRLKGLSRYEAKKALVKWVDTFEMKSWLDKPLDSLSKGMQQKVQFAATLLHSPKLVILDEPFTGFDPVNAELLKNTIKQLAHSGVTVILSTHRMESVEELCSHVAMIHQSQKVFEHDLSKPLINSPAAKFLLKTTSPVALNAEYFELVPLPTAVGSGIFQYEVALHQSTVNELLQAINEQTTLLYWAAHTPTLNDIFIDTVKNRANRVIGYAENP